MEHAKMNQDWLKRGWKALSAATLVLIAGGCASYTNAPQGFAASATEERYRLFFTTEAGVSAKPTDSADALAREFAPQAAVARALEDFQKQGFALAELRRIPWGQGATLFVFRKSAGADDQPLHSPIQFIGTYMVNNIKPEPSYYVLSQGLDHYKLHVISPLGEETINAEWVGRELEWEGKEGRNHLRLSPDGMTLYRIVESATGFDVPRERITVTATRVIDHQKPASDEEREARRYLARLRPATPQYYDPFPW